MIYDNICPVCGGTALREVFRCPDRLTRKGEFAITECTACAFRWTNPYPPMDEIGQYYASEDYVPLSNTRRGTINRLYHVARWFTLRQKRRLIEKVSGGNAGSLLDIGCGTGEFLGAMAHAGWRVLGIEPDEKARTRARDEFGVRVLSLEEKAGLADGAYDVITLWHVLEHAHDVNRNVHDLTRLLSIRGRVLIGVPNYDCFDGDVYGPRWAAYDPPRHLYHFTPRTMRRLLEKHGLRILGMRPMLFDPLYISLLSEKENAQDCRYLRGLRVGIQSTLLGRLRTERCTAITYIVARRGEE